MSRITRLYFSAIGYNEMLYKESETDFKTEKMQLMMVLDSFNVLAEKYHFDFIAVFHPVQPEVAKQIMELEDVYLSVAQNQKPKAFNMLDYFIRHEKMDTVNYFQYFWAKDGHHNARGYGAFARGVEWKLREIGLLDTLINQKGK